MKKILTVVILLFTLSFAYGQTDTCIVAANLSSPPLFCQNGYPSQVIFNLKDDTLGFVDQMVVNFDAAGTPSPNPPVSMNNLIFWDGDLSDLPGGVSLQLQSSDGYYFGGYVSYNCNGRIVTSDTLYEAINANAHPLSVVTDLNFNANTQVIMSHDDGTGTIVNVEETISPMTNSIQGGDEIGSVYESENGTTYYEGIDTTQNDNGTITTTYTMGNQMLSVTSLARPIDTVKVIDNGDGSATIFDPLNDTITVCLIECCFTSTVSSTYQNFDCIVGPVSITVDGVVYNAPSTTASDAVGILAWLNTIPLNNGGTWTYVYDTNDCTHTITLEESCSQIESYTIVTEDIGNLTYTPIVVDCASCDVEQVVYYGLTAGHDTIYQVGSNGLITWVECHWDTVHISDEFVSGGLVYSEWYQLKTCTDSDGNIFESVDTMLFCGSKKCLEDVEPEFLSIYGQNYQDTLTFVSPGGQAAANIFIGDSLYSDVFMEYTYGITTHVSSNKCLAPSIGGVFGTGAYTMNQDHELNFATDTDCQLGADMVVDFEVMGLTTDCFSVLIADLDQETITNISPPAKSLEIISGSLSDLVITTDGNGDITGISAISNNGNNYFWLRFENTYSFSFDLDRGAGTGGGAFTLGQIQTCCDPEPLAASGQSLWIDQGDYWEATVNRILIGGNPWDDNSGFFQIDNKALFIDNGLNGSTNYFFGQYEDWSAAHGGATYDQANNFHYWTDGGGQLARVEFENNTAALQFYIEGVGEAWYGLQDGSTHLWSSGYKTSTTGNDWVWDSQFGLSTTPEMRLTQTGKLSLPVFANMGGFTTRSNARLVIGDESTDNALYFDANEIGSGTSLNIFSDQRLRMVTNGNESFAIEVNGDINVSGGSDRIVLDPTAPTIIMWGTGSPEGAVSAGPGSTYHRLDGGAGTSFYVKESGTGATGWVGK